MWNDFVKEKGTSLSGKQPDLILERTPENQAIFNKMGKSYAILQTQFRDKLLIRADFRIKEFFVKKVGEDDDDDEEFLVSVNDDL